MCLALLALASCQGRKGEMRIRGHLANLNEADLYVLSPDGGMEGIDTIHIHEGEFDWRTQCTQDEATFLIVYPTFSTLTVFGGSGQVAKLEGDAQHLAAVKVSGGHSNEQYTKYRMETDSVSDQRKDSIRIQYIRQNEESPLARYLEHDWLSRRKPESLQKGQRVPKFTLRMRSGQSVGSLGLRGRNVLIAFWANWKSGSGIVNHHIRKARRICTKPLVCISYSLDVDQGALDYVERMDSVTWHSYCDQMGFQSPLASQLGIRTLPYYILVDEQGRIAESSAEWKDIETNLK